MSELVDNRKIETLIDDLQRLKRDAYAKLDQALNVDNQSNESNDTKLVLYQTCLTLIDKALNFYATESVRFNQNESANKIKLQLNEMKSRTKERIDYLNNNSFNSEFVDLADEILNADDDVIILDSPESKTRPNSRLDEFENAHEVYRLENGVQQFFISNNGSAATPSQLTDISIYTFDNDSVTKRERNIYGFLKVGDWMYPIVPNQSPGMKTNYNAYIFPNKESSLNCSFIGVTFDKKIKQDEINFFEDVLASYGSLIYQDTKNTDEIKQPLSYSQTNDSLTNKSKLYPQLDDRSKSNDELNRNQLSKLSLDEPKPSLKSSLTADNISKALLTGAQYLSSGVNNTTEYANKYMQKGSEKLVQQTVPNAEPAQVSSSVRTAASTVRYGSDVTVRVSSYLVDKLKSFAGATARTVAPHIRSGSSYLLKQTGVASDNTSANNYIDSTCKVAHSAVEGFALVYDSLETAAKQLGRNFTEHTVTVVNHKYGSEAAQVTENSLYSVGNVAQSVNNFQNLKVIRTLAKATAKETLKTNVSNTNKTDSNVQLNVNNSI